MARTTQKSTQADAESTAESTTDEMIESEREKTAATILPINNAFELELQDSFYASKYLPHCILMSLE